MCGRTHALITAGARALASTHARKRARTPTYTRRRTQARTQASMGTGSSLPADRAREGRRTSTCQSVPAPRHSAHTRRPPPAPRPRAAGRLTAGGMHGHAALAQTSTHARTCARVHAFRRTDRQTCSHARTHAPTHARAHAPTRVCATRRADARRDRRAHAVRASMGAAIRGY